MIRPIDEWEQNRRQWAVAVVAGDTMLGFEDWASRELPGHGMTIHYMHRRPVNWHGTNAPYRCGAMEGDKVAASTRPESVNCADCLALMGVGTPTRKQKPPYMNEKDDGVFVFHDVHIDGCVLEVVPQATGNVEITLEYDGEGHLFTLSHLDRADLLRALLHDFHYSPERGGPNDEN
ncbi:hypothetical protein PP641_gp086 [Arthrobacter phage SilentRX]|uniref:Uncharacterized protein n=1 Tax=Arthrobacter phage SilentRX TaxID=2836091 RepID=A0A8F3ECQ6_9CAUD|nr:hypothetical protein PP641_gp086 [Arthrobacter phage SilentRX]QWY82826.1 hypothetical protein SEA_SILENTRX_86 [Arthrobacter phage SilentRX]